MIAVSTCFGTLPIVLTSKQGSLLHQCIWVVLLTATAREALAANAPDGAADSKLPAVYRALDDALARKDSAASLIRMAQTNPDAGDLLIAAGLNESNLGHASEAAALLEQGLASLERAIGERAEPVPADSVFAVNDVAFSRDGSTLIMTTDRDTRLISMKDFSLMRVIQHWGNAVLHVTEQAQQLSVRDGATVSTWLLPNGWFLGLSKAQPEPRQPFGVNSTDTTRRCVRDFRDDRLPTTCTTEGPQYRLIRQDRQNCDGAGMESMTWFQPEGGKRLNLGGVETQTCGSAAWFVVRGQVVKLRNAVTGGVLVKLSDDVAYPDKVLCSPNGRRVAVIKSGKLSIWSAPGGDLLATFSAASQGPGVTLNAAGPKPGLLSPMYAREGNQEAFSALGFAGESRQLVTVSETRRIMHWNLGDGTAKVVGTLPERSSLVGLLQDGALLVSLADTLRWIDGKTGATLRQVPFVGSAKGAQQKGELTLIYGKPTLLLSSRDGDLKPEKWPGSGIGQAAFSPDGKLVALGEDDGTVSLCHTNRNGCFTRLPVGAALPEPVQDLAFDPIGRHLAVLSGNSVSLWDVSKRRQMARFDDCGEGPLAFANGGRTLIASACRVRLPQGVVSRLELPARIRYATLSDDARVLVGTDEIGRVALWDVEGWRRVLTLSALADGSTAYALTPEKRIKWLLGPAHAEPLFYCRIGPIGLPWQACRSRLETRDVSGLLPMSSAAGAK